MHIGSQLGPYIIERILNSRNGEYVVRNLLGDKRFFVRYLSPIHEMNVGFFEQRSQQISGLEHPNIVPFDPKLIQQAGTAYASMPYVEAASLLQIIKKSQRKRLSLIETLWLLAPITDALSTAHTAGIVHRNLKPSNILLDEALQVYLTDFDMGGAVGGTAYISPEQAAGAEPSYLDDVYSLGILTYEMLTGHMPYEPITASRDVLTAHDKLTLPSEREPSISIRVEEIILKAFAKKPEQRFQSVAAFREALQVTADSPEQDEHPPAHLKRVVKQVLVEEDSSPDSSKQAGLSPGVWAMIALLAGLAVVVALIFLLN